LARAIKKLFPAATSELKVIGTRHGEKVYETLCTREEMLKAEDLGSFYRVPPDKRNLNYENYYEEGNDYSDVTDYNSHNTYHLSVSETIELLLSVDYVKEALKAFK
jgi:UDP-N-acetylglucosamine 4,6-dehydratase